MNYKKATWGMVVALMVALASCNPADRNNEMRNESAFSEERLSRQSSQHVHVQKRYPNWFTKCYHNMRKCFHFAKDCSQNIYDGGRSYTKDGIKCQKWSSNHPHKHDYHDRSLPKNKCRNPSRDKGPWCFTTDPSKRWDYCFTDCAGPECVDNRRKCFHHEKKNCSSGYMYNGTRSYSRDGVKCRAWKFVTASSNKYKYLPKNYCRNPSGDDGPWCYTTKRTSSGDWDYCFTDCAGVDDCYDSSQPCFKRGVEKCKKPYLYNGSRNFNLDQHRCKKWSSTRFKWLPGDRCRNPDGGAGPWCYSQGRSGEWQYCFDACKGPPHTVFMFPTTKIKITEITQPFAFHVRLKWKYPISKAELGRRALDFVVRYTDDQFKPKDEWYEIYGSQEESRIGLTISRKMVPGRRFLFCIRPRLGLVIGPYSDCAAYTVRFLDGKLVSFAATTPPPPDLACIGPCLDQVTTACYKTMGQLCELFKKYQECLKTCKGYKHWSAAIEYQAPKSYKMLRNSCKPGNKNKKIDDGILTPMMVKEIAAANKKRGCIEPCVATYKALMKEVANPTRQKTHPNEIVRKACEGWRAYLNCLKSCPDGKELLKTAQRENPVKYKENVDYCDQWMGWGTTTKRSKWPMYG